MKNDEIIEPKIAKGFDRDVDFGPMKESLIKAIKELYPKLYKRDKYLVTVSNKLIYCLIAIIQLRNGSRISEAINAFRLFLQKGIDDLDSKVVVKISKSGGIKTKTIDNVKPMKTGDTNINVIGKERVKYLSKIKYRKMMFPKSWLIAAIDTNDKITKLFDHLKERTSYINDKDVRMRKRVLGYMLRNHNSNTHSLRYAFINYMINEENEPLNTVAKFVGHSNVTQLVTYTQQKRCDGIFAKDI